MQLFFVQVSSSKSQSTLKLPCGTQTDTNTSREFLLSFLFFSSLFPPSLPSPLPSLFSPSVSRFSTEMKILF